MDIVIKQTPEENYNSAIYHKKNKNWNKYFMHLTQSANHNYNKAIKLLHIEYDEGSNNCQRMNKEQVDYYMTTAINNQLSYSLNYLGYMYGNGYGVEKDKNLSKKYYELASDKNNSVAKVNLTYVFHDENETIALLNHENNIFAIYRLANIYASANGSHYNISEAIKLYKLAIVKGSTSAILNLTNIYLDKNNGMSNTKKAIKLLEYGMNCGHTPSIIKLASIIKRINTRILLYTKAISLGNDECIDSLARIYYDKQYFRKSLELYLQSQNDTMIKCIFKKVFDKTHKLLTKELIDMFVGIEETKIKTYIPKKLIFVHNLLKSKIDLIDLHFKYSPDSIGCVEAKNDFIYNMLQIK
jgi:TPR repeat protein